jgi:cobalt-zinc-cadmium resistance protein CzcA
VADLSAVVVKSATGRVVRVGDVARVRIGALTRYGAVSQGARARRSKASSSVCAAWTRPRSSMGQARLEELKPSLPKA